MEQSGEGPPTGEGYYGNHYVLHSSSSTVLVALVRFAATISGTLRQRCHPLLPKCSLSELEQTPLSCSGHISHVVSTSLVSVMEIHPMLSPTPSPHVVTHSLTPCCHPLPHPMLSPTPSPHVVTHSLTPCCHPLPHPMLSPTPSPHVVTHSLTPCCHPLPHPMSSPTPSPHVVTHSLTPCRHPLPHPMLSPTPSPHVVTHSLTPCCHPLPHPLP